jgi:hypothetical protein
MLSGGKAGLASDKMIDVATQARGHPHLRRGGQLPAQVVGQLVYGVVATSVSQAVLRVRKVEMHRFASCQSQCSKVLRATKLNGGSTPGSSRSDVPRAPVTAGGKSGEAGDDTHARSRLKNQPGRENRIVEVGRDDRDIIHITSLVRASSALVDAWWSMRRR